jgi:hypothetical protein
MSTAKFAEAAACGRRDTAMGAAVRSMEAATSVAMETRRWARWCSCALNTTDMNKGYVRPSRKLLLSFKLNFFPFSFPQGPLMWN